MSRPTTPPAFEARSSRLGDALARWGIHYGWVVVAVTFLTMMVGACAVGAPGVLILPLKSEFGWSVAEISAAFAVRLALFGLVGPFAAVLLNHFGIGRVSMLAMAMVGTGVAGSLLMSSLWQLLLLWGVVVGVGTGLIAMVLGATVATRWFVARRGLVTGLLTASLAAGQLLFLPAFAALSEAYGWRPALMLLLAMIAIASLAILLLMRDHPADMGLPPYGGVGIAEPPAQTAGIGAMLAEPLHVLSDVARTRTFWVLFGTFFICGATTSGLVQTHLVALCGDFGMTSVMAAGLLAAIGAFNLIGTIGSGWLSDRFDARWLLFAYYGLRGLSLFYLPSSSFGFYELAVFAVFYGLDWLATVPPTLKLTAERFGPQATIVFGWIFVGHQIGAAAAAYSAGYVRSFYDSYMPALVVGGLLCMVAALSVFALRRPTAPLAPAAA